jgi:hypothetical protein
MYGIAREVTETYRALNRTPKIHAQISRIGAKFKSRDQSFDWCMHTSRLNLRRPPWRYSQPKLAQKDPQARQQRHEVVYEKADGACTCTSSRKMFILSHRKAKAEPDGIFRQKAL